MFSSKHTGFWKRHADSFRYSNARWLIITEPMEIIYLQQLLACKEKTKTKTKRTDAHANLKGKNEVLGRKVLWAAAFFRTPELSYEQQTPWKALAMYLHKHFFIIQGNKGDRNTPRTSTLRETAVCRALPDVSRFLHLCMCLPDPRDSGNHLLCLRISDGMAISVSLM